MTEDVPMNRDRNREVETDATADQDALQAEIGDIKSAMGIAETHPYWWRFWIVEGIGVAVVLVLVQFWLRWGFDLRLGAALAGVLALDQLAKRRIKADYEPPPTGLPSQTRWLGIILVGFGALIVGLGPVFERLGEANSVRLALLSAGIVVGVGYMYMGQLLDAYDVRAADQYAFYAGGPGSWCWSSRSHSSPRSGAGSTPSSASDSRFTTSARTLHSHDANMELDKLVHQPTRLRIFAHLYANGETSFTDLRSELDVTQGNLASHIGRMEDADCVPVDKQFVDRKPQTTYRLTERGEELFEDHVRTLETLIDAVEPVSASVSEPESVSESAPKRDFDLGPGTGAGPDA